MIRYSLTCANDHSFDSWFQSAAAYDKLVAAGLVSCSHCGSTEVGKSLMAPAVKAERKAKPELPAEKPLTKPQNPAEKAMSALREHVEKNSEYVGMNFATEARAIHEGGAPERAIHGEAKPDEARKLLEDGVPVAPLPFLPTRKAN